MPTPESLPLCRFAVLTLSPEMFTAVSEWGVTGRAFQSGLCELHLQDPRDEATDRHGTVDDRPYGGGPGMVMQAPVLSAALAKAKMAVGAEATVIALTPQGQKLDATLARTLAGVSSMVLVAGRYEGMDERFIDREVDLELSVGDFVVSGGELPAMLLIDAVTAGYPACSVMRRLRRRILFQRVCWIVLTTLDLRSMKVIECLMSCSAAIMLPFLAGEEHKRSEEPWIADRIYWVGST